MQLSSPRARRAEVAGATPGEIITLEAIDAGWAAVYDGVVVEVLRQVAAEVATPAPGGVAPGLAEPPQRGPDGRQAPGVDLCLALGVLARRGGRLQVATPLPLVTEIVALPANERRRHEAARWRELHRVPMQKIIAVFVEERASAAAAPVRTSLTRSLAVWSDRLALPVETLRHALALLDTTPDFAVDPDPERCATHHEVAVTVDWETFDRTRICVERP